MGVTPLSAASLLGGAPRQTSCRAGLRADGVLPNEVGAPFAAESARWSRTRIGGA
jgi:hypothetical protein